MQSAVTFLLTVLVSGSRQQCLSSNDNAVITDKAKFDSWQTGRNDFGVTFFQLLNKVSSRDNLIFSPSSVHNALLLAYFGAAKETEKSLAKTLKISSNVGKSEAWRFYKNDKLKNYKPGNTTLKVGNKIFFSNRLHLRPCIRATLRTETEFIDYQTNVDLAKNFINNWVANVTEGEIKDAVQNVKSDTTAMIVNTVTFQSHWFTEFDSNYTKKEPFSLNSKETKMTSMMIKTDKFVVGYSEDIKARWLKLPYADENQIMIIIQEDIDNDLDSVIGSLNSTVIKRITNLAKLKNPELVEVRIPKYKHRNRIHVNSVLEILGIGNALSENADYSGFTGKKEVSFSEVEQEAVIEVDEEGTKASAITAIATDNTAIIQTRMETFACDRPFAYFIYDYVESEILFLGTFRYPTDVL